MPKDSLKENVEAIEQELTGLDIAKICAQAASDKKASNIVILTIGELTSVADHFVICSAPSERQVQAIVRNVEDELRAHNIRARSSEGLATSSWVLLDISDVVFHCFTDAARDYYDLEGCWMDAKRIEVE